MSNKHTHTHTVSPAIHRVDGAPARNGRNPFQRGPPLIKSIGYVHREDAVGGGEQTIANTHTHTVSTVLHRVDRATGNNRKQS